MKIYGTYNISESDASVEYSFSKLFVPKPEYSAWLSKTMFDLGVDLKGFIRGYVVYHGPIRTARMLNNVFDMGLRHAANLIRDNYQEERKLYWDCKQWVWNKVDFRNAIDPPEESENDSLYEDF